MKRILLISILFTSLSFLSSCDKESNHCLELSALEDNTNLYVFHSDSYKEEELPNVSYSLNNRDWSAITIYNERDPNQTSFVKLNKNEKVYLKGDNPNGLSKGESEFIHISALDDNGNDVRFNSYGNIMSLIDNGKCNTTTIPCDYCFTYLFGTTTYGSASRLVRAPSLPASKLTKHCYDHMFYDDPDLETAPSLDSSDIKESCYAYMFSQCTSLKRAPKLATSNTAKYCYDHMFYGNASLEYIEIHIKSWDRDGDFPCCFWVSYDGTYKMSTNGTFVCPKELIPDVTDPDNFSETRVPYHWTIQTF